MITPSTGPRPAVRLLAALCLAGAAASVGGQTIYRCGTEYRHQPCHGGREMALEATDPDEADRAAAQGAAERQRSLADALARDREQRESARPSGPAGIGYTPLGRRSVDEIPRTAAKSRSTQTRSRHRAPDFEATDPRSSRPTSKRKQR